MLTLQHRPRKAPNLAAETVEDQTVIVNLRTGVYFSLNVTGTYLWERLDGETSLGAIAADLAATFEVVASVTEPDVLELAGELLREQLITP